MIGSVSFLTPPPGLGSARDFTVDTVDPEGALIVLRSRPEDEGAAPTRLFCIEPDPFFSDYQPEIPRDSAQALGIGQDGPAPLVLVVVTPGSPTDPPTANLLAPVVVNPASGAALQVILDDRPWPLRAPLRSA